MADESNSTGSATVGTTTNGPAGDSTIGNPPATTVTTPSKPIFMDDKGKFVEGWRDHLPEEVRGEKCLELFDDINGMVKTIVHGQKAMGKNKVVLPNDKSPESDWDAYFDAIGRPKTKDDYKADRPDDVPEELWDKELVAQIKEQGWKAGFTPKQVDAVLGLYAGYQKRIDKVNTDAEEAERTQAETALKKEWGTAYDERMRFAKGFIEKTTDEASGQRQAVYDRIGNDPVMIKWCAEWGIKTSEAKGIDTSQIKKTPAQSLSKADELRGTPGYINGELAKTDPARFKRITEELKAIYAEAYPE